MTFNILFSQNLKKRILRFKKVNILILISAFGGFFFLRIIKSANFDKKSRIYLEW